MINNIYTFFKEIYNIFSKSVKNLLKMNISSYCEIQTADSKYDFVTNDGSLFSIIEINHGNILYTNKKNKEKILNIIKSYMNQKGHNIQFYFSQDKYYEKDLNDIFNNIKNNKKLNLFFEKKRDLIKKFYLLQKNYIILYTNINRISKRDLSNSINEKKNIFLKKKISPFFETQNIIAAIPKLRNIHYTFVNFFSLELNKIGIVNKILNIHDALFAIKNSTDPYINSIWKGILPGDNIFIKQYKNFNNSISNILWPSITDQIFDSDIQILDMKTIIYKNIFYSSIFIDMFPSDIKNFYFLLEKIKNNNLPCRISFDIESDGMSSFNFKLKKFFSSILSFSSSENRLLNKAINILNYIKINHKDTIIKIKISATTWSSDRDILNKYIEKLTYIFISWGNSCHVKEICGDPIDGYILNALGLNRYSEIVHETIAPITDIFNMLPIFKDSSPWKKGSIFFQSISKTIWFYEPGSHLQTTWVELFFARSGSGKSSLSNFINLSFFINRKKENPKISIIDVGKSSKGLIYIINNIYKKDYSYYYNMNPDQKKYINIFDTLLGNRFLTNIEKKSIINFLNIIINYDQSNIIISEDILSNIIDNLYEHYSDDNNPKKYTIISSTIHNILIKENYKYYIGKTTWWEISDFLFNLSYIKESEIAHKYAMPILSDILPIIKKIINSINIIDKDKIIEQSILRIQFFIKAYPPVNRVTNINIEKYSILIIDIEYIIKLFSDSNRNISIIYMMARYISSKYFYIDNNIINTIKKMYHNYYIKKIKNIISSPKRIVFDEFHRTSNSVFVRKQIIQDMRESRKYNIQIALISQSLKDFDSTIVEFATSLFILSSGNSVVLNNLKNTFDLSNDEIKDINYYINGPLDNKIPFFAQFFTKYGKSSSVLYSTMIPEEIWSFNTNTEDVLIREEILKIVKDKNILFDILIKYFPSGTSRQNIQKKKNILNEIKNIF